MACWSAFSWVERGREGDDVHGFKDAVYPSDKAWMLALLVFQWVLIPDTAWRLPSSLSGELCQHGAAEMASLQGSLVARVAG